MEIDRRMFVTGATWVSFMKSASLAFATLRPEETAFTSGPWHPFTRSLIQRARRASSATKPIDISRIERIIRDTARAPGRSDPLVIKWLADPSEVFDQLGRYGLNALLQMSAACLWRPIVPSVPADESSFDSSFALGELVTDIVGAQHYDRALMAPKLLAKSKAMSGNSCTNAQFEVRAIAAQIGWLETCMPIAAAQAVVNVEHLLSSGLSEDHEAIHHQLAVFEAYELGLLATWETSSAIICTPRPVVV